MSRTIFASSLLIVACHLAMVTPSTAQITAAEKQLMLNEVGNLGRNWNSSFRVFDERYEGVLGSPLLYEGWHDARVVFTDGRELNYEKLFNIDATTSELLIVLPSNDIVALPSARIDSATLAVGATQHLYVPIPADLIPGAPDRPVLLAELFQCGDIALYFVPLKDFKPADFKGAYSPDRRYDEYIDEPVVFARVGEEFREFKLKKRQVIKALEDVVPDIAERVQGGSFEVEELCGWLR